MKTGLHLRCEPAKAHFTEYRPDPILLPESFCIPLRRWQRPISPEPFIRLFTYVSSKSLLQLFSKVNLYLELFTIDLRVQTGRHHFPFTDTPCRSDKLGFIVRFQIIGHSEPVLTLAWESPPIVRKITKSCPKFAGDCHVAALLAMTVLLRARQTEICSF